MKTFAGRVVHWQARHGRHDLPWQHTGEPYLVWVSEIMLQQTQVGTVIPYFRRFVAAFPDVARLAAASVDDVLRHWSGLGYYSRARNLHRCAQQVVTEHGGVFPEDPATLQTLPGIGRSTAGAIAALGYGKRAAILDGNVKRVFARCFGVEGFPGEREVERRMWAIAERELPPAADIAAYAQGLMDLGATLCTRARPRCGDCPLAADCVALATDRVAALPAPRPRRATPVRRAWLLVFWCAGRVLLEKRPPAGIWGGLWSVPQLDGDADAAAAVRGWAQTAALRVTAQQELAPLRHVFTHFRLQARVLRTDVAPPAAHESALVAQEPVAARNEPARRWMALADLPHTALPAPIRLLLAALAVEAEDVTPVRAPSQPRGG